MADASTPSAPLPHDAVYEILLRLPAKDLCRLRAVCRLWRHLLSDPRFIAAHTARHNMPPLIVAGYYTGVRDDGVVCDIMDLSGDVVRRVRAAGDPEWAQSIDLDLVCISKGTRDCLRLFNMTTGAVLALPHGFAEEHGDISHYTSVAAFGRVASTGEYKVLRVLDDSFLNDTEQLCEVFTLDGSSNARWRGKMRPPTTVSLSRWRRAAVNGIVYFFGDGNSCITCFDLDREEWTPHVRGPYYQQFRPHELSMAAVNDSLVVVHLYLNSCMDLWFLLDHERGLWVKQHSIRAQLRECTYTIRPLLVLNDGRLVLVDIGSDSSSLKIYNPSTEAFANGAEMGICFAVGLYSGSLLSLANRQIM